MSQDIGGPDPSFEDRLKAARSKQGLDAPPKRPLSDQDQLGGSGWGIGARVGVELVAALVVAVAIGYGLDRVFHTTPILTAVFVPWAVRRAWQTFGACSHQRSRIEGRSGQRGRRFEQYRRAGTVPAASSPWCHRRFGEFYRIQSDDGGVWSPGSRPALGWHETQGDGAGPTAGGGGAWLRVHHVHVRRQYRA